MTSNADDPLMNELSVATKLVPNPFVLGKLKDAGRNAAKSFLASHYGDLNEKSTLDLREMYG